jgi:hypothetical protein
MPPSLLLMLVLAQSAPAPADGPIVSDNSFLVEEAYNQDVGVVQHINMFERDWRSGDWVYTFTQEWPVPHNARHQISYTLSGLDAGASAGFGDMELNWRYQVMQRPRVAIAPRVSVSLPTGNADEDRGAGATALDVNLPVSLSTTHVTWHLNAGAFVGMTRQDDDPRVADVRLAGSAVLLPYRRANVLVEIVSVRERVEAGRWETTNTISPGVRWAHQAGAVQIVPGVGLPVTFQRDTRTDWGLIGYLSFEHPFERRR